jgi:iron complex outermembrane receptor protein
MYTFWRTACAIPFLFVAVAALADDEPLTEVVVTADLRDRELRNLPASATVLDAHTLEVAGVQHFEDVLALVPNLNWSAGTSRPRFFQLRGIGELDQWQGAPNPSVGFLIDGIDFSGIGMPATLVDVDRVEILRGPQSTAYGANSLAGLIAVNTRAPRRERELDADVTLGDYDTQAVSAIAGGPIGDGERDDEAAWRLVAANYRSDGFRRNAYLGRDDTNGYDETNARLRFRSHPIEDLRVDVTAMWADLDNGYDAFSIDNSRTTLSDKPGQDAQISRALALRLDYDGADAFSVVSRSSYGRTGSVYSFDADWGNDDSWGASSPYDYFQRFDRQRTTTSSDLRLVSRNTVDGGADFAWLAGAFALRTEEDLQQHDTARDLVYGDYDRRFSSQYRATNLAAYGQLEWRLGSRDVLAIAARVENRSADYQDSDTTEFSPEETMIGGSMSLRRAFDERRSAYVTLSRGYKAGGFNIGDDVPDGKRTFDAEALHSLEIGLRAASVDASITGDVAIFYMRRKEQQVPTGAQLVPNDPATFVQYTDNAAAGENYGMEGTLLWRPADSWIVDLRGAILETRYIDYSIGDRNLDGREQSHAPQYQFDVGLEYHHSGIYARVDFDGLDDFYFDESHDERAPSRVLTNLKAGISGNHWRAEVWVRNMFDRYYSQRGFFFGDEPPNFTPTRYVQAGDPRRAGVTVSYTFR